MRVDICHACRHALTIRLWFSFTILWTLSTGLIVSTWTTWVDMRVDIDSIPVYQGWAGSVDPTRDPRVFRYPSPTRIPAQHYKGFRSQFFKILIIFFNNFFNFNNFFHNFPKKLQFFWNSNNLTKKINNWKPVSPTRARGFWKCKPEPEPEPV